MKLPFGKGGSGADHAAGFWQGQGKREVSQADSRANGSLFGEEKPFVVHCAVKDVNDLHRVVLYTVEDQIVAVNPAADACCFVIGQEG